MEVGKQTPRQQQDATYATLLLLASRALLLVLFVPDSWLYGAPADPIKVATFKEARRSLKDAIASGTIDVSAGGADEQEYEAYMRRLMKGPAEHNW